MFTKNMLSMEAAVVEVCNHLNLCCLKKKEKKVTVTKADAEQTDLPDARMDVMALMFILDQIFISS